MLSRVRSQLAATLAGGGFDPARDIEAITVNRWAHGYAYGYNDLEDPYYEDRDDERYPHVRARKPFRTNHHCQLGCRRYRDDGSGR